MSDQFNETNTTKTDHDQDSVATSEDAATLPRPRRAWKSVTAWVTLLVVLVSGLTLDLWSKSYTFEHVGPYPVELDRDELLANPEVNPIPWHEPKDIVPGWLDFRLVINRGAVFGIGRDKRVFFIVFTVVAITVGFLLFARWTLARNHLAHVAIGLIMAGGLGNLWDRFIFGVVRDFLHLFPGKHLPGDLKWPGGSPEIFPWVFNVADMMLLCGMIMLMIHINRQENKRKPETEEEEGKEANGAHSNSTVSAE